MNLLDHHEVQIDTPADEQEDFYSDDDLFKISSWGADLSFRELISRYDENEMIKPELQRHYVWDKSEASRFVDSILLGLPGQERECSYFVRPEISHQNFLKIVFV